MARSRGSTAEAQPAARSDAYTGLLLIALLAQIVGVAFFFMDWSQYPKSKPTPPPKQVAPSGAPTTGQAGGQVGSQQGGQGGAQQGGAPQAGGPQMGGKGP